MKKAIKISNIFPVGYFQLFTYCFLLIICLYIPANAQEKNIHVSKLILINKLPLITKSTIILDDIVDKYYKLEKLQGDYKYVLNVDHTSISIDALSHIEYAKKSNRFVVYGDNFDRHVISNAYVKFYSDKGELLKSLGLVAKWPFAAALSDNGLFVIAGNTSKINHSDSMYMFCYDKDGEKLWENKIPNYIPTKVFVDPNNKYIALVLYNSNQLSGEIRFYDTLGNLLFIDKDHNAISGLEFLPSNKVVLSTGSVWYLYDMTTSHKLLASGPLKGNTIGKFPILAHPNKDIFFVLTTNTYSNSGYVLQGYNASNGTLLFENIYAGKPSWEPNRLVNVSSDGTIKLVMSNEILLLKLK